MKNYKRIAAILGLVTAMAVLVMYPSQMAKAQIGLGTSATVFNTETATTSQLVTNKLIATTIAALCDVTMDVGRAANMGLQWRFQDVAANTHDFVMVLQKSVDGSNWQTLDTFTVAFAGTAYVNFVTNVPVLGYPYVRVHTLTPATDSVATNCSVRVYMK